MDYHYHDHVVIDIADPFDYAPWNPNPKPKPTTRKCTLLMSAVFVSVIVLIGCGIAIHRKPCSRLPEFSISSFNISKSTLSTQFTLTARNPNPKCTFRYDRMAAKVLYHGTQVVNKSTSLQHHQRSTEMEEFEGRFEAVDLDGVGDDIRSDFEDGTLRFSVRADTVVNNGWGDHTTMRVVCEGIQIRFSNTTATDLDEDGEVFGSMMGPPKKCKILLFL